jgi:hypothetical protein
MTAGSAMETLRELNPNQPVVQFRTLQRIVDHAVSPRRFFVLRRIGANHCRSSKIRWAGSYLKELRDGDRVAIEDETSGTFGGAQADIGSGSPKRFGERCRYSEQRAGKVIRELGLISRIFDLHRVARRNMAVEQQHRTVAGAHGHDLLRNPGRISVRRFAVRKVQHGRRKTITMLREPLLKQ